MSDGGNVSALPELTFNFWSTLKMLHNSCWEREKKGKRSKPVNSCRLSHIEAAAVQRVKPTPSSACHILSPCCHFALYSYLNLEELYYNTFKGNSRWNDMFFNNTVFIYSCNINFIIYLWILVTLKQVLVISVSIWEKSYKWLKASTLIQISVEYVLQVKPLHFFFDTHTCAIGWWSHRVFIDLSRTVFLIWDRLLPELCEL